LKKKSNVKSKQFVQWQVYTLPDKRVFVSNLKTTLRVTTKALALKVAAAKNASQRDS